MNNASRLLRSTNSFSGSGGSSSNLLATPVLPALPLGPLGPSAVPRALEEELEAQARASLALFGFGVHSVNWSPTAPPSDSGGGGSSSGGGGANVSVKLMERVAPLGTNSLLWRAANARSGGDFAASGAGGSAASRSDEHVGNGTLSASASSSSLTADDEDGDWDANVLLDAGGNKVLQQYLVKCVAVLPTAALEEVVELLIRSDRDDMETVMQQLVGARVGGSGFVYRRKKRRVRGATTHDENRTPPQGAARKRVPLATRRQQKAQGNGAAATIAAAKTMRRRVPVADDTSDDGDDEDDGESSGSESDDDDDAAVVVQDDLAALNVGLPTAIGGVHTVSRASTRRTARLQSLDAASTPSTANSSSSNSASHSYGHAHSWSSLPSPPMVPTLSGSYMDGYRRAMARSGHQGNLSIKWVVGDKPSRMFGARATYCLLDYECELVNDWDDGGLNASSSSSVNSAHPMYVRVLRSCYLPQCQPWLDELGGRPRNVQPVGIMVRQCPAPPAKRGGGSELRMPPSVEVQLVASILEKPQLPASSRRAKLRALCAKLGRIEELITSRRLSHSLLTTQPLWVRDRERPGCRACGARFGFSRRRHHCRICGEICCAECCPKVDLALPEVGSTSVRVCVSCRHSQRRKSTESPTPSSRGGNGTALSSPASTSAMTPPGHAAPEREMLRRTTSTGSATPGRIPSSPSRNGQRPPPPPPPPSTPTVMTPPIMMTPPHHYPPQQQPSAAATSLSPSTDHYLSSSSSYGSSSSFGGSLGERKQSIASSVFHKLKSSASLT